MNTLSKPQARELIATELMGWKKVKWVNQQYASYSWVRADEKEEFAFHASWSFDVAKWKPDEDENHFRMVLEKIMEDKVLFGKVMTKFSRGDDNNPQAKCLIRFIRAPLPERFDAVVTVLQER